MPSTTLVFSYDGTTATILASNGSISISPEVLNDIAHGMSGELSTGDDERGFGNLKSNSTFVFTFEDNLEDALQRQTSVVRKTFGKGIMKNSMQASFVKDYVPAENIVSVFAADPIREVFGIKGQVSGGVVTKELYEQFANKAAGLLDNLLGPLTLNPECPSASRVGIVYQNRTDVISIDTSLENNFVVSSKFSNLTAGGNVLDGGPSGTFNTFYIPENGGNNLIYDSDSNGRIASGAGVIRGNALPVKIAGAVQQGQWILNGYQLVQDGNNLLIGEIGANLKLDSASKITIKDFPFNGNTERFGITLGQVFDETKELQAQDTIDVPNLLGGAAYPLGDLNQGRFFIPTKLPGNNYGLEYYDSQGNVIFGRPFFNIKTDAITDKDNELGVGITVVREFNSNNGQGTILSDNYFAFIYTRSKEVRNDIGNLVSGQDTAHLVIINSRGLEVSNKMIVEGDVYISDTAYQANRLSPSSVSVVSGKPYACFSQGGSQFHCIGFNQTTGKTETVLVTNDAAPYQGIVNSPSQIALTTGQVINVINTGSANRALEISALPLKNMPADSILETDIVTPGAFIFPAPGNLIISVVPPALGKECGTIKLALNENSVTLINGVLADGDAAVNVNFDALNLPDDFDFETATKEYDTSDYSIEGALKLAVRRDPKDGKKGGYLEIGVGEEIGAGEDGGYLEIGVGEENGVVKDPNRRTVGDYCPTVPYGLDQTLFSDAPKFVILQLPSNQKIIFSGINKEIFLERAKDIFPSIFLEQTTSGPSSTTPALGNTSDATNATLAAATNATLAAATNATLAAVINTATALASTVTTFIANPVNTANTLISTATTVIANPDPTTMGGGNGTGGNGTIPGSPNEDPTGLHPGIVAGVVAGAAAVVVAVALRKTNIGQRIFSYFRNLFGRKKESEVVGNALGNIGHRPSRGWLEGIDEGHIDLAESKSLGGHSNVDEEEEVVMESTLSTDVEKRIDALFIKDPSATTAPGMEETHFGVKQIGDKKKIDNIFAANPSTTTAPDDAKPFAANSSHQLG